MSTTRPEEMAAAGLNLIQQALSIYDMNLRLLLCNQRFRDMFTLPETLVQPGARFDETIRHLATRGEYGQIDDIDAFVEERVTTARAFEPHYMERTRTNGQVISVEGAPLPNGGWVTVYTDITRTKRQEDMLRSRSEELSEQLSSYSEELLQANRELAATNSALEEAKRELMETEQRIRLTTEMMPAHIAHVDLDRKYTYSNRRLSSIMPERPNDIVGRKFAEVLGAQAYTRIQPHLDAAFKGVPSTFEFNDALSSRRIRTALTPDIVREGDKVNGVYILSTDVTEETQTRAILQQTSKRALAAQMTSGLAHDFSNLLTIILGSQRRLQSLDLPEGAQAMIKATLDAAERGGDLLSRIAEVTAPRTIQTKSTKMHDFLADLVPMVEATLPQNIAFSWSDKTDNATVLLDQGLSTDALLNLILNARDACGEHGKITLTASLVKNTWLDITVTDTGSGFSQDALEHAFDPFYTTKGNDGTGIGLVMAYDAAKLQGGELVIANNYRGARATLRIPLRRADHATAPQFILLVEDSDDLRETIREMLIELGHTVIEANNVEEAEIIARDLEEITLVLSDLNLKQTLSGIDLATRLSPLKKPILFMSSLDPKDSMYQKATQLGPILSKPFDRNRVAQFISDHSQK
jgi:signal transduction histidine kinase